MYLYPANEIREMDEQANACGVLTILLMEHAALALYEAIKRIAQGHTVSIVIMCGHGNNGGDGLALARLLERTSHQVYVFQKPANHTFSKDVQTQVDILNKMGIKIQNQLPQNPSFDVIVDCIFGTGLNRVISGDDEKLIDWINAQQAYVIACDIPSGLHADSGQIMGCCVHADETITFAAGKCGLYLQQGVEVSGKIQIADIHMPYVVERSYTGTRIINASLFCSMLPKRKLNSHKGTYGSALMIGGRQGMSGAIILAAKAALRCGLGTLHVMSNHSVCDALAVCAPEAITHVLPDEHDKDAFQSFLRQFDCIVIGNGLGRDEDGAWLTAQVYQSERPCIFDGDALYLLGKRQIHGKRFAPTLFTPHPKEVSYLLDTEMEKLKKTPLERFYELQKRFPQATFVLKDTKTWIIHGNHSYINVIGNDGLATGGSGDVLCGMICGFFAQNKNMEAAAVTGVYLHAACADKLKKTQSTYSILPHDVIHRIPDTLYDLLNTNR